ncbi:hypothetical protein V9T40_005233 [Parthenolecanium corni]|uniref:Uncharacterized protein n=1 Tax=Parthenolecanium corni TaxID=536013 RepID=A0AAN9TDT3_9HEMI
MNQAHRGYEAGYAPNPAFLSLRNRVVPRSGLEPQPPQRQRSYAPPPPPPPAVAPAHCRSEPSANVAADMSL